MKRALYIFCAALLLGFSAVAREKTTSPPKAKDELFKRIVIPEVEFREASLADVVDFLTRESARLDPDKRGVNIVLMSTPGKSRPVTMHLQNAPLEEVVRYLAESAGLRVRVDKYAVVLLDADAVTQRMETRIYPVSPAMVETVITPEMRRPQLGPLEKR